MRKLNNKFSKTVISGVLLSLGCVSTSALAAGGYVDYRHEYQSTTRVHYDRAKIGYFFDSGIDVHYEIMWKPSDHKKPHKNGSGATTKPANRDRWGDFENNGHGLILNYRYKNPALESWTFTPTFSIYTSSFWTTFEPGLEVGYKIAPEYAVRGRFRVDFDKPSSTNSAKKQKTYRTDLWFDWKPKSLPISMTYNFVWYDTEVVRWDGKKYDWAQEIKMNYKVGRWTPYVAVGDIKGPDKFDDNRQIRFRTGISYGF